MEQYISKDALVAEINNWIKDARSRYTLSKVQFSLSDRIESLENLLSLIDTLEVKEVDLDFQRFAKEMEIVFALPSSKTKNTEEEPLNWEYAIAKHFYELGLKEQLKNK